MTDKYGAVPLPPGEVHIYYDPSTTPVTAQQPQTQQVAVFDAQPNDNCLNGTLLDINPHYCVYAVKNGLLRVLHRHSTVRSLLRAHQGSQVTDVRFFQHGDVLGTVGGSVIIWRIFERSSHDIGTEALLEIPSTLQNTTRLVWHPFNPNQFFLLHDNQEGVHVATLVETTRLQTTLSTSLEESQHAVCVLHSPHIIMEGATQLVSQANITDLCWSNARHVLTTHENGAIHLWDIKAQGGTQNGILPALCQVTLQEDAPVTRCLVLPYHSSTQQQEETLTNMFVTATNNNSCMTLWSPFTNDDPPRKLQTLQLQGSASYNLDVCFGPFSTATGEPSAVFLLLAHRQQGRLYAVSVKAEAFEYVVPFVTKYPTYSWSLVVTPAQLDENEPTGGVTFDMHLHALQSKAVQHMVLAHYMCLAPTHLWEATTVGVRMEPLLTQPPPTTTASAGPLQFDEDYEVDDIMEDDEDNDGVEPPDASSLPKPDEGGMFGSNNPFANWLGAIASKGTAAPTTKSTARNTSTTTTPVTANTTTTTTKDATPPPPPVPESSPLEGSGVFLSPMEILKETSPPPQPKEGQPKSNNSPYRRHKQQNSPHRGKSENPTAILKHDDTEQMQLVLRNELQQTVLPQLTKSMETAVERAFAQRSNAMVEAVSQGVEEPLQEAFIESMKTMMIPAFEAAMNEMFSQVAAALDSNLKSLSNEDLHAKVDVLTAMVQSLSVQVSELGTATNKSAGAAPPPPAPPLVNPMQQMRQEILALLKMKSYEPAFTKALSASTAEVAVFCCQNANVSDVLGGNTPALSQPILLCLMQQLGAVLVSSTDADLQTELSWLQEIALTLDPTNENIQRHVPSVLQQLVTSINTKMQQGDPSLRRQLQMLLQVIRGMQR